MTEIIKINNLKYRYAECSECGYTQYHLLLSPGEMIIEAYQCVECGSVIELDPDGQIVFEADN